MMSDSVIATQVDLSDSLAAYLSAKAGRRVVVAGLTRMSNGWESDVYAFDAPDFAPGGRVLRLYFGGNAGPTALHEFRSLQLLKRAGYPVPTVDLVESSLQPLGRAFLIMEQIRRGVPLGDRWRDSTPGVRGQAIDRFCQLLHHLHTLTWANLPGAEHVPSKTIEQQLAEWRGYAAHFSIDAFDRGITWLQAASARVTPSPLGLVHWDFHPANILLDEGDYAWVIDWTQFMASDIRFDLAWTLLLLASEWDEATSQEVRATYFAMRGWDAEIVQPELDFFEAAACIKRLASVLISLGAGADSLGMRPGAEAIMMSRMARFAIVYRRWLALTQTPLADVETMLAGYL